MSLSALRKRVRGIHGRHENTGVSDYKSWDSFAEDVSLLWRNAWEYNEDGSEISLLAAQLEVSTRPSSSLFRFEYRLMVAALFHQSTGRS